MATINSPCAQVFRKIPLSEDKPADVLVLNKNFDLIQRSLDQLRDCLASKIAALSGTIVPLTVAPMPATRAAFIQGEDGEDGEDGHTIIGAPGITPKTYFDLFLSYGNESGAAALMDRVGADPDFYLRPNTDKNAINQYEGSPGSTWEYEITEELSGTLTLDLMVYQCALTGFGGTPSLVVSVTKNGTPILTTANLDGASNNQITVTLPGTSYVFGDRMGIRVTTLNFSSGALMMTAHASCEIKAIAVGSITGPAGTNGTQGFMGPPGRDGEDAESPLIIPGRNGTNGTNGTTPDYTFPFDCSFNFIQTSNNTITQWPATAGDKLYGAPATQDWAFPNETGTAACNLIPLPPTSFSYSSVNIVVDVFVKFNTWAGGSITNGITFYVINQLDTVVASGTINAGTGGTGRFQPINTTIASIVGTTALCLAVLANSTLGAGNFQFFARMYMH